MHDILRSLQGGYTKMQGQLKTSADITKFMLAGNATFTIRAKATGQRYTYKVRRADAREGDTGATWFVTLLAGPDNENDFFYMGCIRANVVGQWNTYNFKFTEKSTVKQDAPASKAFVWFFGKLMQCATFDNLEVWHGGRCGRCGRKLTVPESIANGLGPECAEKGF